MLGTSTSSACHSIPLSTKWSMMLVSERFLHATNYSERRHPPLHEWAKDRQLDTDFALRRRQRRSSYTRKPFRLHVNQAPADGGARSAADNPPEVGQILKQRL